MNENYFNFMISVVSYIQTKTIFNILLIYLKNNNTQLMCD